MTEKAALPFSTSQASTSSKRHSLNLGPRPLHLLPSGSVLSSSLHSPSRSSALHNASPNSPVSGASHYCTGPLSPVGANIVKHHIRRQSSISYIPSNRDKDSLLSPMSPTEFWIALTSSNPTAAGRLGIEMEEGSKEATSAVTLDTLKQLKGRPPATLVEQYVA